jgi:hypothetical protein
MSKNLLRSTLITAFGAMLSAPMFAHAAVIPNSTTTAKVGFDLSDSVPDKLVGGARTNGPTTSSVTLGTTQVAKFNPNTGVLTGVTVNLTESVHKQTTAVTSAGTTAGSNNTSETASGSGSSTVKAVVTGAPTTSSSLTKIDSCAAKRKDACSDGAATQTANYNFSVASSALDAYAGSGTFGVTQTAALSAETTANSFPSEATTTSTVNWTGKLSATYEYLLHAAQSFDGKSALTLNLDFGSVYLGDSVGDQAFSIFNGAGNRVGLKLTGVNQTGTGNAMFSTNLNTYSNIAAGASQAFMASFLANQLGSYSTSYQLTLADLAPSGSYAASTLYSGYNLTLNLAGNVIARPAQNDVPEPATLMLLGLGAAAFGVSRKRKA